MKRNAILSILLSSMVVLVPSCDKSGTDPSDSDSSKYGRGDQIDFSHVGYHYGDEAVPEIPVVKTVEAPFGDATALIQQAIDETDAGAILFKRGVYQIGGQIHLEKSGVVLRGESNADDGTVFLGMGTDQRTLLVVGPSSERIVDEGGRVEICESPVPVGRMYVEVADASSFAAGDDIVIVRPHSNEWIHDIKMDEIPMASDGGTVQWNEMNFTFRFERTVMKVEGNKLWLDNPVVMEMDSKYGACYVAKYSYSPARISECGVENIKFLSTYEFDTDENHAWSAIQVRNAVHCWVRDVNSQYFGYCHTHLYDGAKNVSVLNCNSRDPKAETTGSRKYAFHIDGAQQCFVGNCSCTFDRHQFVVGAMTCGPNVFWNCRSTGALSDAGPHHRWSMGTLYDNLVTDGELKVQDRGNMGTGHGWSGANYVFWNCQAKLIVCQSPWASALNWCTGCIGTKDPGDRTSPFRPDGVWTGKGRNVEPLSLYEYQMETDHVNVWDAIKH